MPHDLSTPRGPAYRAAVSQPRAVAAALAVALVSLGAPASAASTGGAGAGTSSPGARGPLAAPPASTRARRVTHAFHHVQPVITDARCVGSSSCQPDGHHVDLGGRLAFTGSHVNSGMLVVFRAQATRPSSHATVSARLRRSAKGQVVVTVPAKAISGHIVVISRAGVRSRPFGPIYIVRHLSHHVGPTSVAQSSGTPFDSAGMWIWYLSKSEGGSLSAIVARAHQAGVGTLFIKSSDGSTNYWAQFSAPTVAALKQAGLKVCAWQYVYGSHPEAEADLGARAAAAGADCLVIDAEAEYEGHYSAAQRYITRLRSHVGPSYPVGLASFPYVDYHPGLPYSVFLGPGGAQYNAPQMYWKDIGTTVDAVFAHTFLHNRIYQRAIFPLGQTYQDPAPSQLVRFRELSRAYGFSGLSWWDWQETTSRGWAALGGALTPLQGFTPSAQYPLLARGSKGDEVVWMQEHLASVAASTPTTGTFDATTDTALRAFQSDRHLPVSGKTDAATWQALLALTPVTVNWTSASSASKAPAGR